MVFEGSFQLKPMILWFCATVVLLECFGLSEANPSCRAPHISVFYSPLWQYLNIVESAWPYSPMHSVLPSGTAGLALPKLGRSTPLLPVVACATERWGRWSVSFLWGRKSEDVSPPCCYPRSPSHPSQSNAVPLQGRQEVLRGFRPSDDKAYNASLPLFVKGKFCHVNLVAVLLKYLIP